MTTIAITDTEVAWDSIQTIDGNQRTISPVDKVLVVGNKIMCFAGDVDAQQPMADWLLGGAKPAKFPLFNDKANFDVVVIARTGMTMYTAVMKTGVRISAPQCLGSGGDLARGALSYQKLTGIPLSAVDAVRAAAEVDAFTGGEIKCLSIKKFFARKRREEA